MVTSPTGVSIRVMTYDDIASEMGLKPASARQLVRRNGWRRVPGNDGRTRIEVPVDELERAIRGGVDTPVDVVEPDVEAPVESPFEAPLVAALTSHIERLERALTDSEAALSSTTGERDDARASVHAMREEVLIARGQIDVMRVQLDAERDRTAAASLRAEEAIAERDRWHESATTRRSWWRRMVG